MLTGELSVEPSRRYTIAETARLLGMCRKTLWKYTRSRDIVMEVHPATGKRYYTGTEIKRFYDQSI